MRKPKSESKPWGWRSTPFEIDEYEPKNEWNDMWDEWLEGGDW